MILKQYAKFLVNGGLIGLVGWCLQSGLFHALGQKDGRAYAIASVLTYMPLILLNFTIQRQLIFSVPGRFSRFVVANIFVMLFVSALSPLCREILALLGGGAVGDQGGFVLASLIGATPSFLLSRYFVFSYQAREASS